ncbi:MAG: hypothetical protein ACKOYM_11310, partial [Actinomycetes bacterium]
MRAPRELLYGPTPWALPCWGVGLSAAVCAILTTTWLPRANAGDRGVGAALIAASVTLVAATFTARRGCRVVITATSVSDQVFYWSRWTAPITDVRAVRVAERGWRWFEVELADRSHRAVSGAGPTQFPLTLLDRGGHGDQRAIELLSGQIG